MTSHSLAVRVTTISWGAAIVILMATVSCDSIGTEPEPLSVPAVPKVPAAPAAPGVPGVPEAPMVPITHGQIAFLDPSEGAIFVADSTGRRIQRVSQTAGALDLAVSPDGKNIAFSKYCDSTQSCRQMYVISVDGIDPLLLQTGDTRDHPAHPTWSPDGKLIAFAQQGIGTTADQIFSINADGTGVTQLTHSGYNLYPEWSPDGSKILLTHSEDAPPGGLRYGIYEIDSDGSNLHGLLSGFRDSWPTWSPDGSRIAFIDLNPEGFVFSLVVINADGSNATALKSSPDFSAAARPAWSPDGKSVTFIVPSASRMCEDIWDFGMVPCGLSAKRVGLDGVIDPRWELPSASYVVWQR
jgi:Tol biopolymer transport system component